MKLLLDTCTFLWLTGNPAKVSPKIVQLFQSPEHDVYLSAVSAWEIAVKYGNGGLNLTLPPETFVPAQREAHRIAPLAIDEESALHVTKLPALHHDPFDRMLVCQALVHGLTILTPDRLIAQYPARTLW